jgi:hypothetical protein
MNDTTNSALKAGRLIVGDDKSENVLCGMHVVELVVGHASGFLERTQGKKVVDHNKPCNKFCNRVRKCVKEFSDRKTKSKMDRYTTFCKTYLGYQPIKIPLPSKTRVAGNFRMYEGLLRSHTAVQRYVFQMTKNKEKWFNPEAFLNAEEWQQLAEYSAIYEKTTSLVMDLQADSAGSLSIAKLQLATCILELGGTAPVEKDQPWDPFEVDDTSVLFDVVKVNYPNIAFTTSVPYNKLPRRMMCLPLKKTDAESVSFIVETVSERRRATTTVVPIVQEEPHANNMNIESVRLSKKNKHQGTDDSQGISAMTHLVGTCC